MRKPFNVTLIHPAGYIHSLALKEAADYVHTGLLACGYESRRTVNDLDPGAYNIVFCGHLLRHEEIPRIPPDTIIFNSEQLEDVGGWHLRTGAYQEILRRFWVWDYSRRNLERIPHDRTALIPFLYHPSLVRTDIRRKKGLSLLFYGSITERRRRILTALQSRGIAVETLFGQYDFQRDVKMLKAWAVLNIHKDDGIAQFEPIRCFYPLINEVPVVSEESPGDATADAFRDSVFFFEPARLVEGIRDLYANERVFADKARDMLASFKRKSAQAEMTAAVEDFMGRAP